MFLSYEFMKKIILFLTFTFFSLCIFSQENINDNNLVIKTYYGLVNMEPKDPMLVGIGVPVSKDFKFKSNSCFGFDLNYKLNSISEAGIYFNYSGLNKFGIYHFVNNDGDQSWSYNLLPSKTIYYGLSYLYHFHISVLKGSKLDIYSLLRTGFVSEKYFKYSEVETVENYSISILTQIWDKPEFEIGLGAGVNYFLFRNFGIFAEAQCGKFHNYQLFKFKTGLVFKF